MANNFNLAEFEFPYKKGFCNFKRFTEFIYKEHAQNTLKHAISYIFNTNAPSALDAFDILEEKRLEIAHLSKVR
jgi:hypothetical protein